MAALIQVNSCFIVRIKKRGWRKPWSNVSISWHTATNRGCVLSQIREGDE